MRSEEFRQTLPEGGQCIILGQAYKIGFKGLPFVYRNGEWCRTKSVTSTEVKEASEKWGDK